MDAVQACLNRCCPPCGGDCCPPTIVLEPQTVPAGDPAANITLEGVCFEGISGGEIRNAAFGTVAPLPTLVSVSDPVIGVAPALDSVIVVVDTEALVAQGGDFTVVLTNECGCCAVQLVSIAIPPPP